MVSQRPTGRAFVLGLDAATFTIIDVLLQRGELPHLAEVIAQGARASLTSTVPPVTPPAWTSMTTGVNPGKHGIFDFFLKRSGGYTLAPNNAATIAAEPVWSQLGRLGKRVCIYNVPFTYPPRPVNGILVAGPDAPGVASDFTYPSSFKAELLGRFPDYQVEVRRDRWVIAHNPAPRRWYQEQIMAQMESQFALLDYLWQKEPWDFFMGVITAPDRLQHVFWRDAEEWLSAGGRTAPTPDQDAIFACYRRIDEQVGRLRAQLPADAAFLIVSDHGFGLLEREVFLNQVLEQAGLLAYQHTETPLGRRLRRQVIGFARTHIPVGAKRWLKRRLVLPQDATETRSELAVHPIDWAHTQAFALGLWGGVWLNIQGREEQGIVPPEQAADVCRQVTAALERVRDPFDGQPLVERVYRRAELYHGPLVERMPDLMVVMRGWGARAGFAEGQRGANLARKPVPVLGPLSSTGHHRADGVLIVRHPWVTGGASLQAGICDVTPTLLYLMGLPVPQGMDGQVLTAALQAEALAAHPPSLEGATQVQAIADGPAYSAEDEAIIEERLRGLGYIE